MKREQNTKYYLTCNKTENFLQKIQFCSYLGKESKKGHFISFSRKLFHLIFLKTVSKDNYYDTYLFIPNSMSGKILGLELLSKMLSTNQIMKDSWKSNISIFSRHIKPIFFIVESQINWGWSSMATPRQINSKLQLWSIFKRQIWSSFLCILNSHKQRFL